MSEAAAVAVPSPVKKGKKKPAAKKPAAHPKYGEMVASAIVALAEKKGSSRQAIAKFIKSNNKVADNCDIHIKSALKREVGSGHLKQVKGTGASGSFKLGEVKKPKKLVVKKKKPAGKKSKKPSAAKKPAKKPAAAKKAKKPAAPKKKAAAKKPAAKKAKKPAPKKAKKAVQSKKKAAPKKK